MTQAWHSNGHLCLAGGPAANQKIKIKMTNINGLGLNFYYPSTMTDNQKATSVFKTKKGLLSSQLVRSGCKAGKAKSIIVPFQCSGAIVPFSVQCLFGNLTLENKFNTEYLLWLFIHFCLCWKQVLLLAWLVIQCQSHYAMGSDNMFLSGRMYESSDLEHIVQWNNMRLNKDFVTLILEPLFYFIN